MVRFFYCIVLLLSVFAIVGCNEDDQQVCEDDVVVVDDYPPECKLYNPFYDDESGMRKNMALEGFLRSFSKVPKELGFSLDDDVVVFSRYLMKRRPAGVVTMYTKRRNVNLAWSSDCNMTENLSAEQMAKIDSLEEKFKAMDVPTSKHGHNCMGGDSQTLYTWNGVSGKGSLENYGFWIHDDGTFSKEKLELHDFFENEVFAHECKEQAETLEREKEVKKFREYEKKRIQQLKYEAELQKYIDKYGDE